MGENGPEIFAFASPASPLSGAVPLAPQQVADFAAGFLYVEVHLEGDSSGEIRGQIGNVPQQQSLLEIPTLGEWGLMLLALTLLAAATWKLGGWR